MLTAEMVVHANFVGVW